MKSIIPALLVIALALGAIHASAADTKPYNDPNAAMRYLMAMGYMPDISKIDATALSKVEDLATLNELSEDAISSLSSGNFWRIKVLLDFAAKCPECNFMPDANFDPQDYVPPFRQLRSFARFLNARAWIELKNGSEVEGAELLVSTFRLGDDVENHGPLISYMVGFAIRNIAMKSMRNLTSGNFKPEAKKVIIDYLKALPRPAFPLKEGIVYEKVFGDKILQTLSKDPKGLAEIMPMDDESKVEGVETVEVKCFSNQRVLNGSIEMALMDGIKLQKMTKSSEIQEKLVADKYLRSAPECPDKGTYQIKFTSESMYEVSCSCGANEQSNGTTATRTTTLQGMKNPVLVKKALAYYASGKFAKDRKELMEYYDKVIAIDPFQQGGLEMMKSLKNDYESRENFILDTIAPNFEKCYEKQIKLQQEIDELIK